MLQARLSVILSRPGCRGRRHHQNPWRRAPAGRAALSVTGALAAAAPSEGSVGAVTGGPSAASDPPAARRRRGRGRRRGSRDGRHRARRHSRRRRGGAPGGHRGHRRRRRHAFFGLGGGDGGGERRRAVARAELLAGRGVAAGGEPPSRRAAIAQRFFFTGSGSLLLWAVTASGDRAGEDSFSSQRGPQRARMRYVIRCRARLPLRRAPPHGLCHGRRGGGGVETRPKRPHDATTPAHTTTHRSILTKNGAFCPCAAAAVARAGHAAPR